MGDGQVLKLLGCVCVCVCGLNWPDLLIVVNEDQKDAIQARRYIEWNRQKVGGWVRRR